MNVMVKKEWIEKGYVDEPVDEALDLKAEIRKLCKEKDAIILSHYYTVGEIQDIADFVGDSLALARKAAETDAQVMVMCGVHFMAETCKLLSPDKTVICPDLNAGCSLADSCKAEDLKKYKEEHPGYKVVSYVNTTAAVKALTDCVVTSGNAKKVIDSFPQDEKIIFGPDYNLGNYINSVTGRNMLLWNGGCHVHEKFSVEAIVKLKQKHPEAVVMAHLECKAPVPPEVSESGVGCSCNECEYMKMNTLKKIYNALKFGWPTVEVAPEIAKKAVKPIEKMLSLS